MTQWVRGCQGRRCSSMVTVITGRQKSIEGKTRKGRAESRGRTPEAWPAALSIALAPNRQLLRRKLQYNLQVTTLARFNPRSLNLDNHFTRLSFVAYFSLTKHAAQSTSQSPCLSALSLDESGPNDWSWVPCASEVTFLLLDHCPILLPPKRSQPPIVSLQVDQLCHDISICSSSPN